MICWGLDPGYARLGFGIVSLKAGKFSYLTHGVIETPADCATGERLLVLESQLKKQIKKHPPEICMIEEVFFRKNLTTGVRLLQARGVILLTMARVGCKIYETSPTALKKMLTGHGSAEKKQMQQMSAHLLGLKTIPEPDDAADALALAIAGALRERTEQTAVRRLQNSKRKS